MMRPQSRRQALRASVQVTALAATSLVLPLAGAGATSRDVPKGPMTLARVVDRNLKDGRTLSVARKWEVHFVQSERGIVINGSQINVNVDVPAVLAPMAKLERERSTDGMFPILLDPRGRIVAAGNMHRFADMRRAISVAENILGVDYMHRGQAEDVSQTLRRISLASSRLIEVLPEDLFFPVEPYFETRRPLALPNGKVGEFVVRFDSEKEPSTGMLRQAERRITTRIGAQERFSREFWSLI